MKNRLFAFVALSFAFSGSSMADVLLINAFEVPALQRGEVIAAWEDAHAFLAVQLGYIETTLHGAITPDARFELINVARWESTAAFLAVTRAMKASFIFKPLAGTVAHPALYEVIRAD